MTENRYGAAWTRDELVLALYLYCQIPFARTRSNQPDVIRLAKMIGRTPSSVARKLGNFGSFDPVLASSGISGLAHASNADRQVWEEFNGAWDALILEYQTIVSRWDLVQQTESEDDSPLGVPFVGPTERVGVSTIRLSQAFFRNAVLSSYRNGCGICGLEIRSLLVASHIVPWAVAEEHRSDPRNGLCLCSLHDRAFDCGLISVTDAFEIGISTEVRRSKTIAVGDMLQKYDHCHLRLPERFLPRGEFLSWHRENVFRG